MKKGFVFSSALPALVAIALSACSGLAPASPPNRGFAESNAQGPQSPALAHVVIVVQENRSFDNLFALFPGANGATRGKIKVKVGSKYVDRWQTLHPHALVITTDIQHCHQAYLTAYDGGKMDSFDYEEFGVCPHGTKYTGTFVYQYAKPADIQPYWDIAEQWGLADDLFQTQGSGSYTAHQDLIRGDTRISRKYSLVDNPTQMPWGCDHVGNSVTSLITKIGAYLPYIGKGPPPCTNAFPHPSQYATLRDLLDAKGVLWKYYSPCYAGSPPSSSCGNNQCKTCSGALMNAFDTIAAVRYGPQWGTNVSMPETNIFTDIQNGALPAVSWVVPEDQNSDHPGDGNVDDGPSWVASVVNAVGKSPYWTSSAVVVLWDDWGGLYDHVVPPQHHFGGLGFRVPMLVISPYVKQGSSSQDGYISHTQYEFGSILRFVEDNWNLGRLGTTDSTAASIGDMFDFSQNPRQFHVIPSQHSITYFRNHRPGVQHGDPE